MAEPLLSIEVDAAATLRAMDQSVEALERRVKAIASATADRVVTGGRARVSRATGATAAGIHKEETHDQTGYIVLAWDQALAARMWAGGNNDRAFHAGKPRWLEFGTRQMTARPFFFQAADLEAPGFTRQIAGAINDSLDEAGLGD